jgi:hypothetical protein
MTMFEGKLSFALLIWISLTSRAGLRKEERVHVGTLRRDHWPSMEREIVESTEDGKDSSQGVNRSEFSLQNPLVDTADSGPPFQRHGRRHQNTWHGDGGIETVVSDLDLPLRRKQMQPLRDPCSFQPRAAQHHEEKALTTTLPLSERGQLRLGQAIQRHSIVDLVAPTPGFLVYIESTRLSSQVNEVEPLVFSAIDANTHLQIARLYLTASFASAIDFVEFALSRFPFPVLQIRTNDQAPFYVSSNLPTNQRFSGFLQAHMVHHSIMSRPLNDELYPNLSKFSFARMAAGSLNKISSDELMDGLSSYLLIHNNYRELPSLQGRTPLEKLHTFGRFKQLYSFDPFTYVFEHG